MLPSLSILISCLAFTADPAAQPPATATKNFDSAASISKGVDLLLSMQENFTDPAHPIKSEWPYEGVYRVKNQVPIGYRVGGTAIAATTLLDAPDYDKDPARQSAVARAIDFVCAQTVHPLMSIDDYNAGYDVRGWGYTYALNFLCRVETANAVPPDKKAALEKARLFFLDGIERTQIPEIGGWNYARPTGKEKIAGPSTFMTAPTLQALFEAKNLGLSINPDTVKKALDFLESARGPAGSFTYAGKSTRPGGEPVPSNAARMAACETTLFLAGRGDLARVRSGVDTFIVHWEWLNKRRAQTGTHIPPYSIAPYYFYYGHRYAAQAVELLPKPERVEYRRRLNELLASVQLENGSWNDRVFPRTANFGTAFTLEALMAPTTPPPATWSTASK